MLGDRWITSVAGVLAVAAGFFPTTPTRPPFYHGPPLPSHFHQAVGKVHMTAAVALLSGVPVGARLRAWVAAAART